MEKSNPDLRLLIDFDAANLVGLGSLPIKIVVK